MGQDASLDFDKICEIGVTRSTARRSHRRDDLLVLNDKFLEIHFRKYRNLSCKSVPYRPKGIEGGLEVNRGLVYESSSEVGRTSNGKRFERRRRKIELPRGSNTSSCLSIVDSLCSSDDEIKSSRSSVISGSSRATVKLKCSSQPCSAEGLRRNCDRRSGDAIRLFSKSFSVKAERPPPPFVSETCRSSQSGSRTRFSPVKKMLDPMVKSKSLQSPLSHTSEHRAVSNHVTDQGKFEECRFRERPRPSMKDSPVQLHGLLERKEKHRVPLFEFSVDCPKVALVAKTWKENMSFDWVYTFHSRDNRKKTFAEGMVSDDCLRESMMIGQMQVCCHISSEPRSDGGFHNSSVTEFVLFDTAHVMRSTSRSPSRTSPASAGRTNRVDDISTATTLQHRTRRDAKGRDHPFVSVELGPELEVAAIVVQVPYEKSESLEYQRGANSIANIVNVVIPAGNHGLPNTKGSGPSPLLGRWRTGGGCDCGGWDIACPLGILGNPSIKFDDRILVDKDKPLRLHVQGTKDRILALTMKFLEEGFYEIDFHAQLSSLQAFSICIAMLHSIDAIKASRDEDKRNPNSPEMFVKEGGQFSIDPIWKMVNVTAPSYLVNPPFSPIARV